METRIIGLIIGLMAVLLIGMGVLVWTQMGGNGVPVYEADGDIEYDGTSVDSGARIEIEKLRSQIEGLDEQIKQLERRVGDVESRATAPVARSQDDDFVPRDGPNQIIDSHCLKLQDNIA